VLASCHRRQRLPVGQPLGVPLLLVLHRLELRDQRVGDLLVAVEQLDLEPTGPSGAGSKLGPP
jgi:hypothetical protein